ncbi:proto-oncogene Mas-like [Anolis carolinensis]|uniref:proto-oncogene Mas-like n=1 Tax=Anolis carolinensis TaxID=28377 RepID=UPI002F2B7236
MSPPENAPALKVPIFSSYLITSGASTSAYVMSSLDCLKKAILLPSLSLFPPPSTSVLPPLPSPPDHASGVTNLSLEGRGPLGPSERSSDTGVFPQSRSEGKEGAVALPGQISGWHTKSSRWTQPVAIAPAAGSPNFTTYILHLSVADFGLLTVVVMHNIFFILNLLDEISFMDYLSFLHDSIFLFTFLTSQFLLTIISIDRCVCLFFPLWHRCHRPPRLSTVVCVIIWILSLLISSTNTILNVTIKFLWLKTLNFFLNVAIFMPIMCVSTVAMLIKVSSKPQQNKRGRLLRAILFTLAFFLLFAFPFNVIHILVIFQKVQRHFFTYAYLCASLNSTINPMIYYLVGRDKRGRSSKRINIVFEKLFKEEEDYRRE